EVSDLGQTRLKNIVEPMRVYSLQVGLPARTKPNAAPSLSTADTSAPAAPEPSIAVLPFQNMSDDPSQEFFVDGLVEDIITDLSKLGGLMVISRNSSFSYKGRPVDVLHFLGVAYLIAGKYETAVAMFRQRVILAPGTDFSRAGLASAWNREPRAG